MPSGNGWRLGNDIADRAAIAHVTVCICTRDRGACVMRVLRGLAASDYQDFDVVVVDQCATDETARALRAIVGDDPRYTYVRSQSAGTSAAHNIAIAHAQGPIAAFTDDDCEVPPQWLSLLAGYFRAHPDVAQICGAVRAGPHNPAQGFIPTCAIARPMRIANPWLKWRDHGIGANMAFRLDTLRAVGPFDELLGPGARLHACMDGDITYRMLKAGHTVLDVPDAYVIHHGFRNWEHGRRLMRNCGLGIGAAYMKHLRLGDVAILPTLIFTWIGCIAWKRLLLLRGPTGLAFFLTYALGMMASFRHPIDWHTQTYAGNTETAAPPMEAPGDGRSEVEETSPPAPEAAITVQ